MAKTNQQFTTIRSEGALLPPDILQRISSQKVDGMGPTEFHLPEGFKITESITQSWDMLKKHWKSYQEAREQLSDTDTGTALTNERWLLPLFRELDYGRLATQSSPVIEERVYPIERFYNNTPIHLIGCNLTLDRRTKGARGAATSSPHSMVQEYLNRSDDHLWAFVSNGLQLRLLRDNVALSRQAFVEFDLEGMMEGEVYSDFVLLWMLCHQSRVEANKPEDCWLEKWTKLARDEGTRVLNDLRNGVADAIEALGRGFISHKQNDDLRRKLQETGSLSKDDFYRQLLRVVYRLLFLFVAEDREFLHPPEADEKACDLYRQYYSINHLREMSLKLRGSKHGDLWHSLSLVFSSLGKNEGCWQLGLVGLGSFLWQTKSTIDLAGPREVTGDDIPVQISNDDLLLAIRALAYLEQDKVLRSVDYRNLGSEELGSVYESLLELHPEMHVEARQFDLRTAAGNQRKITGSYYTPDSLVECLLDSAFDPVVEDRLKGKKGPEAEQALLNMTVCDPACGSGHFLIAAAHRLARHLARVRTGDAEPSPEDHQHALRDVIGRCIYGVDINPMAVELCKVSLWIEAIEPGKPLSFLDHHIQCGNSLLGTTPRLLADGIPDNAFKPIEGDVKTVASDLKRLNKRERKDREGGQGYLFDPYIKTGGDLSSEFTRLSMTSDGSITDIVEKERLYADLVSGTDYQNARLLADAWCGVFVWKKDMSDLGKLCPTERDFRSIEKKPHYILPDVKSEVQRLTDQYQFFHWHLAFPDVFRVLKDSERAENKQVGWNDGFDVVVGNPPWERVKLQQKEWFAQRRPEIAQAPNAAIRKRLIKNLEAEEPELWDDFLDAAWLAEGASHLLRDSNLYPLCGRGDVNLYTVFAELFRNRLSSTGRFGAVLPSGIATDDTTKFYFQDLVEKQSLASFYDFENRQGLFPDVDSRMKFCLLTAGSGLQPTAEAAEFAFFCHAVSDLREPGKRFLLSPEDIERLNPNTRTCPIFRSTADAELSLAIRNRHAIWGSKSTVDGWMPAIRRVLDINLNGDLLHIHSEHPTLTFDERSGTASLYGDILFRMYEGKMVGIYNHRLADAYTVASGQRSGRARRIDTSELLASNRIAGCRAWVPARFIRDSIGDWPHEWYFAYMDVCSVTNERTVIGAIIPMSAPTFSLRVLVGVNATPAMVSCLLANFQSFAFDYYVRQFVGGLHLSDYIMNQMAVIEKPKYSSCRLVLGKLLVDWIVCRVLELTCTAWDLEAFALDCGYDGPPFRWDEDRRFLLRCELDAAYFHMYLGTPDEWGTDSLQLREMFSTPRNAVEYIMETFPIVKRKDIKRTEVKDAQGEVTTPGNYMTKDTILAIYDEMQEAIDSGQPYQTRLDPPPGPPVDASSNFIPMPDWDKSNWPSHVHPSKS